MESADISTLTEKNIAKAKKQALNFLLGFLINCLIDK
jgi:hypothetical protein